MNPITSRRALLAALAAGPQELRRYQVAEIERWKRTAERAGLQPE